MKWDVNGRGRSIRYDKGKCRDADVLSSIVNGTLTDADAPSSISDGTRWDVDAPSAIRNGTPASSYVPFLLFSYISYYREAHSYPSCNALHVFVRFPPVAPGMKDEFIEPLARLLLDCKCQRPRLA